MTPDEAVRLTVPKINSNLSDLAQISFTLEEIRKNQLKRSDQDKKGKSKRLNNNKININDHVYFGSDKIRAKVIDRSKNNMCKLQWLTIGPNGEPTLSSSNRFFHSSKLLKIHQNLINENNEKKIEIGVISEFKNNLIHNLIFEEISEEYNPLYDSDLSDIENNVQNKKKPIVLKNTLPIRKSTRPKKKNQRYE